jgi:hypothetical protein
MHMKTIAAVALVLGIAAGPAIAAEHGQPAKLTDAELDQVAGGDGSLLDLNVNLNILLKNIAVTVNVSNVPINAGIAVQANALGQAIQTATVIAGQQVTQAQALPTFNIH